MGFIVRLCMGQVQEAGHAGFLLLQAMQQYTSTVNVYGREFINHVILMSTPFLCISSIYGHLIQGRDEGTPEGLSPGGWADRQ